MISSKKELKSYMNLDRIALNVKEKGRPRFFSGEADLIWKYEILLRKVEYFCNCFRWSPLYFYNKIRLNHLANKLGFSIPINVCGPGLSIAHRGTIIINGNARIGSNCRIQSGVTVGTTNGKSDAPIIGNNVFIGDGAKIIGSIRIADDCAIGANSVVVKDILEQGTTWGGIPAKKISNKDSHSNLSKQIDFCQKPLELTDDIE